MKSKENAAPVDQTGSGDGDQIVLDDFSISTHDSITLSRKQQGISSLLMRGSANAVPLSYLQRLTGLDGRTIRKMIWRERLAGACVCEDNRRGYYLALSLAERDACARSMEHRAAEIQRTAQAIARAEVLDG